MTSRTTNLGESYLQSGELLTDEDDDSDSLLADELRGMYRNRLKDMEEVEEKREEAHRVRKRAILSAATTYDVNKTVNLSLSIRSKIENLYRTRNCYTIAS